MRRKKTGVESVSECFYPRGNKQDCSVAVVRLTSWGSRRREGARRASDVALVGLRGIAGGGALGSVIKELAPPRISHKVLLFQLDIVDVASVSCPFFVLPILAGQQVQSSEDLVFEASIVVRSN
jgi:hypothetical protein